MTKPTPTIAQAYAHHRRVFRRHTPFGVLLRHDMICLIRATARDARVTVAEVLAEVTP